MVLEPINVDTQEVANIARANTIESTAGFGIGAIIKGIFALALMRVLTTGHRRAVKRIRVTT